MSWGLVALGELCSLITDGKHGDCQNDENSGYYFISAKDIRDGKINYDGARQILESDFVETHRRTDLQIGDVLITNSGTIGRLAITKENENTFKTTFQKSVAVLKPIKSKISSEFLYYSLEHNKGALISGASGAAQKNLLLGQLRAFKIKVPEKNEQIKITSILKTYDDLIENNRRRIQLLEESARLLYREWFVHLLFPSHEHSKIVDGVPEGWSKKLLTDIAVVNENSLKNGFQGNIEYIDISCVSTHSIDNTTWYDFTEAPNRARRILKHGDIIWSCVRPNRKSYAFIWQPHERLIASTGFAVISAKHISAFYLYQAITNNEYVGYLTNNAGGVAYPAVTAKVFENSQILVPPANITENFDQVVENTYKQINLLRQSNKKLAEARDLLLPRLMNSEIST